MEEPHIQASTRRIIYIVAGALFVLLAFGIAPMQYRRWQQDEASKKEQKEMVGLYDKVQKFTRKFNKLEWGMPAYEARELLGEPIVTASEVWYYDQPYFERRGDIRFEYVKRGCIAMLNGGVDAWELEDVERDSEEWRDEPCRQFLYNAYSGR